MQSTSASPVLDRDGDHYEDFLAGLRANFDNAADGQVLFTTTLTNTDLYPYFRLSLPLDAAQHYNCRACADFVNRFGGLVRIDPDGKTVPVMWNPDTAPDFFKKAVTMLYDLVRTAEITGVFVSSETTYGKPVTGPWHHMAVSAPKGAVWSSPVKSASQRAAELREDSFLLTEALKKYSPELVNQALAILKSEALYRSVKVLGVADWLSRVQKDLASVKSAYCRSNLRWWHTATAPAGFCHVSSTMIGTLLDDLADGLEFDAVKARFEAKMNPTVYQRPQAAPAAGNLAQAEKVIEALQAAGSLKRRYARLDEIAAIWRPVSRPVVNGHKHDGVFAGVQPKASPRRKSAGSQPTGARVTMTWDKFAKTVLPTARKIEYFVRQKDDAYCGILTASDLTSPPILQWDNPENRNPFSWYVYSGGSSPASWKLEQSWVKVNAITFRPSMWQTGYEHQGQSVIFILDGARDTRRSSLCLFPETLKAEFHGIRAAIEAYSRLNHPEGANEASACGIMFQAGLKWDAIFRVTNLDGLEVEYLLDRWD